MIDPPNVIATSGLKPHTVDRWLLSEGPVKFGEPFAARSTQATKTNGTATATRAGRAG